MGVNRRKEKTFPSTIWGQSPLGGNGIDTNADGDPAPEVPLFYDPRVGMYISEQAIEELDDREYSEKLQRISEEEESFRARAGFKKA